MTESVHVFTSVQLFLLVCVCVCVGPADRNTGAAGDGGEVLPKSAVCNTRHEGSLQQETHQPH